MMNTDLWTTEEKNNARKITSALVRKGIIKKESECALCKSSSRIHAHHFSYDITSIVIWLCIDCHNKIHHSYYDEREYEFTNALDNLLINAKRMKLELKKSRKNSQNFIKVLENYNSVLIEKLKYFQLK